VLDERSTATRNAALNSVRTDPGLHQLVPYFMQFVADKVTHQAGDMFVLTQMLHLSDALLQNKSLYVEPYISALVPPILTCLMGKSLGSPTDSLVDVTALRDLAASLISSVAKNHSRSSTTLQPRLARTLLKAFLDPNRSFGAHYGALLALHRIIGVEGIRQVILPNLKTYDTLLEEGLNDEANRPEAELVLGYLLKLVEEISKEPALGTAPQVNGINGDSRGVMVDKVGAVIGERLSQLGGPAVKRVVMGITPNLPDE
jgi:transcription initiation factor TFIID subunit 6